jgi:hypothetical protein
VLVVGGRSSSEAAFPLDAGIAADDLTDYTFQVGIEGTEGDAQVEGRSRAAG